MFFNIIASLVVTVVAFVPLWIYLGARWLFSPEGFWQEFFLFGVGVWMLVAAQICFLIVGLFLLVVIWVINYWT